MRPSGLTGNAGALRGNFNQLRKLKKSHPRIKVIFSFGGWAWSGGFGQAVQNPPPSRTPATTWSVFGNFEGCYAS
ncbi:Glycosyl hydrolases family 18 [Kibdelosporangium aridum]|uniref:Glycosyl hydrolases family 18 n=1 Tax=Kibdelosporangium aridum TaxID=2030 RepID=A0A1W2FZ59_KIBAR|nr:Glycosyl hydrolases family 18 [Kibdelosporangium aridum]